MKKPPVNSWRRKCLIYAVKVLNGSGQHVKFSAEYPIAKLRDLYGTIMKERMCVLAARPLMKRNCIDWLEGKMDTEKAELEKKIQEIVQKVEDWPDWKKTYSSYAEEDPLKRREDSISAKQSIL